MSGGPFKIILSTNYYLTNHTHTHIHTHTHTHTHILYIYIYIYVLLGPVKPESGIILVRDKKNHSTMNI